MPFKNSISVQTDIIRGWRILYLAVIYCFNPASCWIDINLSYIFIGWKDGWCCVCIYRVPSNIVHCCYKPSHSCLAPNMIYNCVYHGLGGWGETRLCNPKGGTYKVWSQLVFMTVCAKFPSKSDQYSKPMSQIWHNVQWKWHTWTIGRRRYCSRNLLFYSINE